MAIKKNNKGQALIEFLVTISFSFGMVFLFVYSGIAYVRGYLVHYATFVASRVYLVHDTPTNSAAADNLAETASRRAFEQFQLSSFGIQINSNNLQFNDPDNRKYEFVGAWAEFKTKMSPFSFFGGNRELKLRSESFLGRSPTVDTCKQSVCMAVTGEAQCPQFDFATLFDNGC